MNKQFFARLVCTGVLALLFYPGIFAQSTGNPKQDNPNPGNSGPGNSSPGNPANPDNPDRLEKPDDPNKLGEYDEIIIKRKDDKDARVMIEIRDNQVWVDGKPVSQYENDTLSVRKRKIRVIQAPEGYFGGSFRGHGGVSNFRRDDAPGPKPALLGVFSDKNEADGAGAKIREVTPGSAAEKAGLQKGDLITGVDEIKIENPENLYDAIHKYKPRDKVTITYKREGKEQKADVVLGEGKPRQQQPSLFNFPDLGAIDLGNLEFRNLPVPPNTPDGPRGPIAPGNPFGWGQMREEGRPRLGIHAQDTEDGKGVKVLEVDQGSSADKAGIKVGDIITRFDGKEIANAPSLAEMARTDRDKTTVKVGLTRNGVAKELELKVPKRLKTVDL